MKSANVTGLTGNNVGCIDADSCEPGLQERFSFIRHSFVNTNISLCRLAYSVDMSIFYLRCWTTGAHEFCHIALQKHRLQRLVLKYSSKMSAHLYDRVVLSRCSVDELLPAQIQVATTTTIIIITRAKVIWRRHRSSIVFDGWQHASRICSWWCIWDTHFGGRGGRMGQRWYHSKERWWFHIGSQL